MVLKFRSRTHGNIKEPGKISIATSATAFHNICPNRRACPANLTGQTKQLFSREFFRNFVDLQSQFARFVPNLQVSEVLQPCPVFLRPVTNPDVSCMHSVTNL